MKLVSEMCHAVRKLSVMQSVLNYNSDLLVE